MNRARTGWLLAGLISASPVMAQDEPDADIPDADIVVEGARVLDRSAVSQRVREAYPSRILREPVMRYHDPVCLQVNGLGPSGNAQVLERMREVIRSLDIPLASPDCRANAVVVVATDPVAQLERIHSRSPRVLSADLLDEKSREFADGAHAVVWHNRTVRGAAGNALPISDGSVAGWTGQGGLEGLVNNSPGRPSRYRANYSVAADIGVVTYDATKLDALELDQLADHAVMRLLAPGFDIEVPEGSPETVLSGVENGAGPPSLTRLDRAVLSALYTMPPNAFGAALGRAAGRAYANED